MTPPAAARLGAALEGFLVLGAGLAERHAHVDQPRRKAEAVGLDDLGIDTGAIDRKMLAEPGNLAAGDQEIALLVEPFGGVEKPSPFDQDQPAHAAAFRSRVSMSRQAMRTATPSSTWSRMALRSMSSATVPSISTPRFIGPGCMISASGLARASLS